MSRSLVKHILLTGIVCIAGSSIAHAHAFLDHSVPGVGSTVSVPPAQVRIWFTEALERAFSTIKVTDASGREVDQGKATVDAKDPMVLEIGLSPLNPGTYRVAWRVVSVDTHPTEGNFTFTVKP
jgi:methionine-rich copper-binding protein CopC